MLARRLVSSVLSVSYTKSCAFLGTTSFVNHYSSDKPGSRPLQSRKAKSIRPTLQYFVDKTRIRTIGGRGGDGVVSYLSEWAKEFAGADGGDGGNGGHIIFKATSEVTSLNHCSSVIEAEHGEKGGHKKCTGKNAKHNILKVPIGTIIKDQQGKVIADLDKAGMMFIAARGGAGGRGNSFFVSDTEQTPDIAEYGAEGEERTYWLEVRSMAHVGLLGFPNAGKSTLLQAITRARSKIAPYPFTTLHPHIGMILYDDYEQLAVADLPGLIPGSHKNKGLGIQFLQHVERCLCLIFIVDVSIEKPWKQIESLKYELSQFNPELLNRPKLIVANKIDLPDTDDNVSKLKKHFKDYEVIPVSAMQGTNLLELLYRLKDICEISTETDK